MPTEVKKKRSSNHQNGSFLRIILMLSNGAYLGLGCFLLALVEVNKLWNGLTTNSCEDIFKLLHKKMKL